MSHHRHITQILGPMADDEKSETHFDAETQYGTRFISSRRRKSDLNNR